MCVCVLRRASAVADVPLPGGDDLEGLVALLVELHGVFDRASPFPPPPPLSSPPTFSILNFTPKLDVVFMYATTSIALVPTNFTLQNSHPLVES